jgi:hypothetical protein
MYSFTSVFPVASLPVKIFTVSTAEFMVLVFIELAGRVAQDTLLLLLDAASVLEPGPADTCCFLSVLSAAFLTAADKVSLL